MNLMKAEVISLWLVIELDPQDTKTNIFQPPQAVLGKLLLACLTLFSRNVFVFVFFVFTPCLSKSVHQLFSED